MNEKLVEYGKLQKEYTIYYKLEMIMLTIGLLSEIGMIIGFIISPILYIASITTLTATLVPVAFMLSGKVQTLRRKIASLKNELHLD